MKQYISLALKSIKHRKIRAWLTILGIVIGIATIIALISVSNGLETAITTQFEKIGSERIYIFPGKIDFSAGSAGIEGLTKNDVKVLNKINEIDKLDGWLFVADSIEFKNEQKFSHYIRGMDMNHIQEMWELYDLELIEGRWPKHNEKNIAMLGYKAAKDLFDKEINVRNKIEIKDSKFEVIGVFEQLGTEDDDYSVILPIEQVRDLYNKPNEISAIEVHVKKNVNINLLAENIERKLKKSRGDEDFTVLTPEQLIEQFNTILNILRIVLGGIAIISLLVGGLGIMNVMYSNVLERTKEIGIMKSVGATYNQILSIFIVEAGIMGIIGGTIGTLIGSGIAFSVEAVTKMQGFKYMEVQIDFWLISLGIIFAIIVGLISGYLPAKKAAKLSPVDALRD